MQLEIVGNRSVGRQNRRFHWKLIAVGEDSVQRDVNDVSVIQLNSIDCRRIGGRSTIVYFMWRSL